MWHRLHFSKSWVHFSFKVQLAVFFPKRCEVSTAAAKRHDPNLKWMGGPAISPEHQIWCEYCLVTVNSILIMTACTKLWHMYHEGLGFLCPRWLCCINSHCRILVMSSYGNVSLKIKDFCCFEVNCWRRYKVQVYSAYNMFHKNVSAWEFEKISVAYPISIISFSATISELTHWK